MITDMLGKEIAVGSIVAYPGRKSSSLWLTVARVEAIETYGGFTLNKARLKVRDLLNLTHAVRSSWVHCLDRVVVVER